MPGSPPASGGGNSRSITPVLDGAHAATATIGHDGGTLTATGADGSTYTLTLPAGALAGDIAITLTPVSSIAGLPLSGGAAAAVDIAPDGLALMQPATLAINPATAPPVADQRGFSWHDDPGHEVYLRGLEPKAPIEMQLEHFSGYGVGSGTPTASWTPSRTLDQLEQDLVQALIAERARVLAGETPDPAVMDQYLDTLVAAYDQRVKPRMQAAETDDELATSAVQLGYGWAHQAAILDSAENPDPRLASRTAEIEASVRRILSNAFDKAYAKCMAGEPAYAQRLVGFERWSQILGYGLPDGVAKARECLSFELTVDAMVDAHVGFATFEEHVVVDRLPIRIGDQDFTGRGTKQLTFPKWTASGSYKGCSIVESGIQPAMFTVTELSMQFNLSTEMGADGREKDVVSPPDITLKVNPGIPHEQYTVPCDGQVYDANLWLLAWAVLHHSRIDNSGAYTFTQLETTGGKSPWAETTFNLTQDPVHQHLELKLDHTPGAP